VGDHGEAAEAEQVGAAVGVGVEPRAEAARGRPDQEAAELAPGRRGDLLAERVEELPDRALEELQREVAGEAAGDDDVGGAAEEVAPLGVAAEVDAGRLAEERVRPDRELVALLRLLADREQ